MAYLPEQWFDLARLGFPGWEHTQAHRATTNGAGTNHLLVRMQGSDFEVRLFDDGRGMFKVVTDHIERVEALISKQDRKAA